MSVYFDNYIDEEGEVDEKLTLNSNGFACLTEDIESLVDKYTGVEDEQDIKEIEKNWYAWILKKAKDGFIEADGLFDEEGERI